MFSLICVHQLMVCLAAAMKPDLLQVARLLNTRLGRYLSSHSFVALTALMFCAMAAVPVGLFVTFAVVTMMISAVGFVFCEGRCAHPCAVAFYDTAPPGSHKPVTCVCSLSIPVVCRRVGSALGALWYRPLRHRGLGRRQCFACHHFQPVEPLLPTSDKGNVLTIKHELSCLVWNKVCVVN